jgi:hypothetical protein
MIRFRHGAEYKRGVFSFEQSKTDAEVTVPISATLRELLEETRDPESLYLFREGKTGQPFLDEGQLWHTFDDCRPKGPRRQLRALRHTAVMEMQESECTIPEIVPVTGHSLQGANRILQVYMARSTTAAENAQRNRGLIK